MFFKQKPVLNERTERFVRKALIVVSVVAVIGVIKLADDKRVLLQAVDIHRGTIGTLEGIIDSINK